MFFVIATAAVWINTATTGIFSFLASTEKGFVAAAALTIIVCLLPKPIFTVLILTR